MEQKFSEFRESNKSPSQFKDPVSNVCLASTAVAYWSLTQEVVGSSPFNDNFFVTEFAAFNENI